MNLLNLEIIQQNHRKELEQRLENAKTNLKNLDRMAEECFREIDRRAHEDRENFAKVFHTLTTNEEVTIASLKEELGIVDLGEKVYSATEVFNQENYSNEHNTTFEELSKQLTEPVKKKNGGKKDAAI